VVAQGNSDSICRANYWLGRLLAEAATVAIDESGIAAHGIAAIASHGQTVWHVPGVSTLQIGEAAVIAERCQLPVISDFRARDIAAGGQGAPLVPIADAMLFSHPDHWRAVQNIGGIGNVSVVPPGGDLERVLAFDTGPGVVVMDGVVRLLTGGKHAMDRDGMLSRDGRIIPGVVQKVLQLPFFPLRPPKSTGRELFTPAFMEEFIAGCRAEYPAASDADIIATAAHLTAQSIAGSYRDFVRAPIAEVLVSGGGFRHPLLRDAIARALAPVRVRDFSELYFDGEAKEAVAFALLGFLHLAALSGNVPSATGAQGARVLGKLTPA
jgi:anhydro-N-acetylmuramic acid kinase